LHRCGNRYYRKKTEKRQIKVIYIDHGDGTVTFWGEQDGHRGFQPTSPTAADSDADELSDSFELLTDYGANTHKGQYTDPSDADTDVDGMADGKEYDYWKITRGLNPVGLDSDLDGMANMLDYDSDNDGLSDGQEVKQHKTDPIGKDTDGDGLDDYAEVKVGWEVRVDLNGDGDFADAGEEYPVYPNPKLPDELPHAKACGISSCLAGKVKQGGLSLSAINI
jgi:hypothetical protein